MYLSFFTTTVLLATVSTWSVNLAKAESHTFRFQNNCGFGTPTLVRDGQVVATGDFTSNGKFETGLAFLQTGPCSIDGVNCQTVEMNMANPQSFADLSLIHPHIFNVETEFAYYGGDGSCDGFGASCADANCDTAYHVSDDDQAIRSCNQNDINLLITFCGGHGTTFTSAVPHSLSNLSPGNVGNNQPPPAQNSTGNSDGQPSSTPPIPADPAPSPPIEQSSPPAAEPSSAGNNNQSTQCNPRRARKRSLQARASDDPDVMSLHTKRAHVHKRATDLRGRRVRF